MERQVYGFDDLENRASRFLASVRYGKTVSYKGAVDDYAVETRASAAATAQ